MFFVVKKWAKIHQHCSYGGPAWFCCGCLVAPTERYAKKTEDNAVHWLTWFYSSILLCRQKWRRLRISDKDFASNFIQLNKEASDRIVCSTCFFDQLMFEFTAIENFTSAKVGRQKEVDLQDDRTAAPCWAGAKLNQISKRWNFG